jgi:hypothetical protein
MSESGSRYCIDKKLDAFFQHGRKNPKELGEPFSRFYKKKPASDLDSNED